INTSYFDIERATDTSGFVRIGTETAKGNTGHNNEYVYVDDQPVYGNNFYRLKEFDIDGKFIYSSIVMVRYDQSGYVIIAPNPAKDYVSIKSNEVFSQIQLIDMSGRIIRTYHNSTNSIYSLSGISKGMYYLRLIGTTDTQTHKLMIQ
ncbi:MAG TPA: T9SS type A sorting domain-containing protein, partial [Chitinophagaceae bacterium]|nr:T9SS type A sorting domain-containing protein [Chitinophagaceae bacterium]